MIMNELAANILNESLSLFTVCMKKKRNVWFIKTYNDCTSENLHVKTFKNDSVKSNRSDYQNSIIWRLFWKIFW